MALFPVFDGRRYGYANETGAIVISHRFTKLPPGADSRFVDGLALAWDALKAGFIDERGRWVLPARWESARPFSDGLAPVASKRHGGLYWTYVDRAGATLPGGWFKAGAFAEDRAFVEKEPGSGFEIVDREGRAVATGFAGSAHAKDLTARALPFREGLAAVSEAGAGRWGFVDRDGAWAIPPRWKAARSFSEGLACVQDDGNQVIFIDRSGAEALRYGRPDPVMASFSEGLVRAPHFSDAQAKVYLDRTGALRIRADRAHDGDFSCGRALYRLPSGATGFVDARGTVVIGPQWPYAEPFWEGLARVVPDPNQPNHFAYIDTAGHVAIPAR